MTRIELLGAGGEPVDFARTVLSHGVADLPPNAVAQDGSALDTVLLIDGEAQPVRVVADGPGRPASPSRIRRPRSSRATSTRSARTSTTRRTSAARATADSPIRHRTPRRRCQADGVADTAKAADVNLNELKPVGSSTRLKMPNDGATPVGKEVELAERLAAHRGQDFVFPKAKNQAGIDGFWRDTGQPVQFKTLTGSAKRQPSSMVEHANDAYDKAAKNGWTNVEVHIEAPSITKEEAVHRWNSPNATVKPKDMSGGALESITVHCSDGTVTLPLGKGGG